MTTKEELIKKAEARDIPQKDKDYMITLIEYAFILGQETKNRAWNNFLQEVLN